MTLAPRIAVLAAVVSLAVSPAALVGQAPSASTYSVPRTPWGDPDVQGIWPSTGPLTRDDGYGFYEYACHEGNHAMRNILSGARAAEK